MERKVILIVEDDKDCVDLISHILDSMGCEISDIVSTAFDAIQSVDKKKPDLILMDIMLKGKLDGIYAAEQIRNKYDMPIVFLTSYGDVFTIERAEKTNPSGYIIKPFKVNELKASIEIAFLKHKSYQELKSQKRLYEDVFKDMTYGVITVSENGRIKFLNNVAEILLGYTIEQAGKLNIGDILCFSDRKINILKLIDEPIANDEIYRSGHEILLLNKHGIEIPIDVQSKSSIREDGYIDINILFRETDILKKYRVRQKSKNLYSRITNRINIMVISYNTLQRAGIINILSLSKNINVVCECCTRLEVLDCMSQNKIDIVLINDDNPSNNHIIKLVKLINKRERSTKILVLSDNQNNEKEISLLERGVHGILNLKDRNVDVLEAINSVINGDLWYRRKILNIYIKMVNRRMVDDKENIDSELTPREKLISELLKKGYKNKEVAGLLFITEKTVKNHISNINKKLFIRSHKRK